MKSKERSKLEMGRKLGRRIAGRVPALREPLVAGCVRCHSRSIFSADQIAAAQRIWKLGSGQPGRVATELLGGDGTTNQCGCGMEGEVVCSGRSRPEVQWRRSRLAAG